MKKIYLLPYILSILFLIACSSEQLEINNPTEAPRVDNISKSYTIPIDSALSYLYNYMSDSNNGTRSSVIKNVKNVTPIRMKTSKNKLTRSSSEGDSILYVVNFENDEGYAYLAADTRIDDNVIAIIDEGSVNDSIINEAIALMNQERPYFEGYPTDGPGFFTTPETGDEVFINPNTVSFYFPEENDMLIGNYDIESEIQTPNSEEVSSNATTDDDGATFATIICMNYAIDQIENNHEVVEYEPSPTPEGQPGWWDNYPGKRVDVEYSPWSIKEQVSPILERYGFWHQGEPFKHLCPNRRRYIICGPNDIAPCGCFPLAISKIFAHFESPSIFTYNGYTVDWVELKRISNPYFFSESAKQSAAHLLKGIGDFCGSWYFNQGTFTFPKKAVSFMRRAGYPNAQITSYSDDKVINMLLQSKPLLIYGIPGKNIFSSHCWNIDGYRIKEQTITTRTFEDGRLIDEYSTTIESEMIHCDFGWGGTGNGYFVFGVFDMYNPKIEYDFGDPGKDHKHNYSKYIHLITY